MRVYRNILRQASLRGIPFETDSVETNIGKRVVIHEFPKRDKPFVEEMGRKVRIFSFNAFVLEPEYMKKRDLLIKAIERPGEAELVHPTFGTIDITIQDCQIIESSQHGGMPKFVISFIEAGKNIFPSSSIDSQSALDKSVNDANLSVANSVFDNLTISGFTDFVRNATQIILRGGLDSICDALEL